MRLTLLMADLKDTREVLLVLLLLLFIIIIIIIINITKQEI